MGTEWNICKDIEKVSVHIHSSFIDPLVNLFIYGITSNSSRKEKVDLYSTREKQAGIYNNSPVRETINPSSPCALLFYAELCTNKTFWEVDEVNGGKGTKVSKICSFTRAKLAKTHTFFHMITKLTAFNSLLYFIYLMCLDYIRGK